MKNKRKILLRADGNSTIGLGHVYRCIAIAERLNAYYDCYFAIQNPSPELTIQIELHSKLVILPANKDYSIEAIYLRDELLPLIKPAIIVLDGYFFDTNYQEIINKKNFKLVCIDDDQPFKYDADVIINHAEGIKKRKIQSIKRAKIYTGFKYALIRKSFIEYGKEKREIDKIKNLFICFGGADSDNVSLKVLKASLNAFEFEHIHIVVGSANQNINDIKQFTSGFPKISIYQNLNESEMIKLMQASNLAIVPASTISLECMAIGLIIITGTTALNQKNILNGFKKVNFAKSIVDFINISSLELSKKINKIIFEFKGLIIPPRFKDGDPLIEIFRDI